MCSFNVCVFFPRLLIPFGKIFDRIHTICFMWPHINSLTQFLGFSYSMHCPLHFPVHMKKCYNRFSQTKVALYNSMLAVVRGSVEKLEEWCR